MPESLNRRLDVTPAGASMLLEGGQASALLRPGWPAARIDTGRAHSARIANYLLGGRDCYEVDWWVAENLIAHMPQIATAVRANHEFGGRVVRHLLSRGVRQFLDIGAGLPNTGCAAQSVTDADPHTRVVCVDNDPIAVTYARALLECADPARVGVVHGDLREPEAILADPRLGAVLDLARPVAVLMFAVLHFVENQDDPADKVRTLMSVLSHGSYLAVSHVSPGIDEAQDRAVQEIYRQHTRSPLVPRSREQTLGFFGELTLVAPGLVRQDLWGTSPGSSIPQPGDGWMYGGLACKE